MHRESRCFIILSNSHWSHCGLALCDYIKTGCRKSQISSPSYKLNITGVANMIASLELGWTPYFAYLLLQFKLLRSDKLMA